MNAIDSIAACEGGTGVSTTFSSNFGAQHETAAALRFITCGSVDDGKSTLIGRLLVDSKAVLQDQLAGMTTRGANGESIDLARLTDGLSAEREQGITIDVAYRYFATARRKFVIGDAPGHEQYTRNMVTAASSADAAVVLVDATKLAWAGAGDRDIGELLPQTRRHALLAQLLRVPSIVFVVNKLDAIADAAQAFRRIASALAEFADAAAMSAAAAIPVSALEGWNVARRKAGWCGYQGPCLLELLEALPSMPAENGGPCAFPVQWVERASESTAAESNAAASKAAEPSETTGGRRIFWGRVASGRIAPGQPLTVMPGGQTAIVARVLDHVRRPDTVSAGRSGGIVLDRELDISRGDWLLAPDCFAPVRQLHATVAWLDDEPLVVGRVYWALQGHRWVKAKVARIAGRLDIASLQSAPASQLERNAIGTVVLALQQPLVVRPFAESRALGSLVLVDTASHRTAGAVLVR